MFPHYRFTWRELLRGLPYAIARDVLFALRYKYVRKLPRVPATRVAHFLGIYRGVRHQTGLAREMARQLKAPESNRSVVHVGPGQHRLEIGEPPRIHGDQSLVQVAFANVGDWENGTDYSNDPVQEYAGIVVQSRGGLRKGQKVAGISNHRLGDGGSGTSESYAEFLAAEPSQLQRLPQDTPLKHGALIGTVAICLEGLASVQPDTQKSACVVGAGPVGNLCAQLLGQRGLKVTVVDQNDRWLSLLDKYEVDTLRELGPLEGYDYLIETQGNPESVAKLISGCNPAASVISMGTRSDGENGAGNPNLVCPANSASREHLNEALRLVNSGAVSLEDHTASVEPLEAYESAWEGLRSGKQFNVLLSVSPELEDL
jgi:threonine dehydrogenase-like Zn-dependent dehydrogenase